MLIVLVLWGYRVSEYLMLHSSNAIGFSEKKIGGFVKKTFQALEHATAHTVSCQSLTTETRVQSQASPVHMGFVVNIVELEQVFLQLLWFTPVSIIPSVLHTHILFTYHWCCMIFVPESIIEYNALFLIPQQSHTKKHKMMQVDVVVTHESQPGHNPY